MKIKKFITLFLSMMVVFSLATVPVSASSDESPVVGEIQTGELDVYYPLLDWSYIQSVTHGAYKDSSGRISYSSTCITYDKNHSSSVTVSLQKLVNGQWKTLSTSTGSGTFVGGASGTYSYSSGKYRTKTTVIIYNAYGSRIETPSSMFSTPTTL